MKTENKKIALVLSGHLRTYMDTFLNLKKNLLDLYDCDIYISTWNNTDHLTDFYHSEESMKKLLSVYSPWTKVIVINESRGFFEYNKKNIEIHPTKYGTWNTENSQYKTYQGGNVPEEAVNRLTSQWYAVSEGFKSIKNYEKYDFLIRSRFDIDLLKPFNFVDEKIVVGDSYGVENYYNIRDYIVYIKPEAFDIMKNISALSIENFKKYNNFSAETMLEYTLKNNDLKIPLTIDNNLRYDLEYRLKR